MTKHEHFDLSLHGDDELREILGAHVVSRKTMRCWPLSSVEHIVLDGGAGVIYKSYNNLPIESAFYAEAKSHHIPEVIYNRSDGSQHWLILECVEGEHPDCAACMDLSLDMARRIRTIIDGLGAVGMFRYDVSQNAYSLFAKSTVELLRKLRAEGKLKKYIKTEAGDDIYGDDIYGDDIYSDVDYAVDVIDGIHEMAVRPEAIRAAQGRRSLLHGDLKYDNVLVKPGGGLVVIDWQNIAYGPESIDIYSFLASQGIDPTPLAGIGPELLRLLMITRWYADCLDRWLPYYDFISGKIAALERKMRFLAVHGGYGGTVVTFD